MGQSSCAQWWSIRRASKGHHLSPQRHAMRRHPLRVDDAGVVTVDGTGQTRTFGVWAAGNMVDARAQVITAARAGSAAAIAN